MEGYPQDEEVNQCVRCGSQNEFVIDYTNGSYICTACGVVQPEQLIDNGREWRDFESEDAGPTDRARAEKADELNSLGTTISSVNFGSSVPSSVSKTLVKYSRMANTTAESKSEHNLRLAFSRISELAETLQIPVFILQTAKEILMDFEKKKGKNMKGFRKDPFLVAVLLVACRNEQGGRTVKGFARATEMEEREIKKFYKLLLGDPHIKNMGRPEVKTTSHQTQELVEVYSNRLRLPYRMTREAKEIAAAATTFLEGKRPSSIAAAALLLVLHLHRHQDKQSELANVSANTLRNVFKDLTHNSDLLPHLPQLSKS